ncbi:MAG: DUF1565 domain-containing protein [Candidatus Sabulitectum sp.]|nr:DUF1565 domain-containing protein [Candidatus Sabulitectum sp.]
MPVMVVKDMMINPAIVMKSVSTSFFLCIFVCFSQVSADSFCVAPYGDDNNPGTPAESWQTIGKANTELYPGDTVLIRAGSYNERICPIRSGTSWGYIT